ncbi:MAG: hypothetical protein GX748_19170, partial [Lentisphaerae bacterium]|nr:hypothetical protein [Lentisphaerota bacterium]
MKNLSVIAAPVIFALLLGFFFMWGFCRVQVPAGHMAIVTAKTGRPLPAGEILAAPGEKGVRRDPLPEGRHFLNPVNHEWRIVPAVNIPVGKIGVVTSKVGKDLPPGEILSADSSGKGIWKDVLGPGAYRLNPEGYKVDFLDAVNIPIGYVGIVTSQTGKPVKPGAFAGPGEQGVMREVLHPGLYYINPRAYQVDVLEIGMNQVSILGRSGSVVLTKGQIATAGKALESLQQTTIQTQQAKREEYLEKNRERGFLTQQALSAAPAPASSLARGKRSVGKTAPSVAHDAAAMPQKALPSAAVQESVAFGIERFVEFPSRDGFQILLDMTVEFELLPE